MQSIKESCSKTLKTGKHKAAVVEKIDFFSYEKYKFDTLGSYKHLYFKYLQYILSGVFKPQNEKCNTFENFGYI